MNIQEFKKCRILVIGDLMIDEYLWGEVDRISPEAPVQVVAVQNEEFTLGGSGNVVNNLVALGAKVATVGVVGSDRDGVLLRSRLGDLGVDIEGVVEEADRCTTRKTRIIAAHQHVLRIDRESRKGISEKTFQSVTAAVSRKIRSADMVLISDYGKGVVSASLLDRLIRSANATGIMTIADPKGIDFKKYAGVTLLTPNKKEAAAAAGMEISTESDLVAAGNRILRSAGVESLLVTCGQDGMLLFEGNENTYKISADARQVFDVSGAGDTVVAVLGLAVASGAPLRTAAAVANTAAGIVVGKVGTSTVSPKELSEALDLFADTRGTKQVQMADLAVLSENLNRRRKKIVLTNGCFDLLHAGHIQLFSASKKLGDVLVVAIDDDRSVSELKGPGRPVLKAKERVQILSALDSVDHVVVFSAGELEAIIQTLRPAVLTKGSNYTSDRVYGHELLERIGGRVVLIPITQDVSSSRIIETIKKDRKL
jgi:D-beta-D-heptose 7-phosphate kinase/D-beta-D-heptose 1-phosphate adenosyltransferase